MTKRKISSEEFIQKATKMPKLMEIEDGSVMDMDVESEDHLGRNAENYEDKSIPNRRFGYVLNQKTAKKKLLMGALKAPFEKEEKSSCLVLHFNDGSYFYSVLSIIESWKKLFASGEAIKSDKSCNLTNTETPGPK